MSKAVLRDRWERLKNLDGITHAERGFALEELLFDLAVYEGLKCRPSFRPEGEQIDGILEVRGRFILVEAKWTAKRIAASEVYAFRAKVEGKLDSTLGLFIAVNDFADAVPDVLRYGKQVSVLLCTGEDIALSLQEEHCLEAVIVAKLWRAAQYGEVLYTYRRHLDEEDV